MKKITIKFDIADPIPLTVEELEAITEELNDLVAQGCDPIGTLIFHDMGITTDGKFNFMISGRDDNEVFVTRYPPDDFYIEEQPNV